MSKKLLVRGLALACVLPFVAAACGDNGGKSTSASNAGTGGGATPTTAAKVVRSGLLKDSGPCDTAKPAYPVGIIAPFENAKLSLIDQVDALDASVKAFNSRGGIGGHCMNLTKCDDKADANVELDCARKFVSDGIVATLNDTTSFSLDVPKIFEPVGLPRVGVSPGSSELASKISYAIGAGGTGTTFMMVPGCARLGLKKIAMIHVDSPTISKLFDALGGMLKAYGAEIVAKIPVTAGTTDFQQFILSAEKAGANCVALPLGENEAVQVLTAAQQLGSKLTYSASLGTFGLSSVQKFGAFAGQMILNAELPPATADQAKWPILKDVIADLSASGKPQLQKDQLKSSPVRSWVAVYHLKEVVEKFGTPDVITRDAINAAFQKATDVNTFGLIPPWTPAKPALPGVAAFQAVSQPWYYQVKYNVDTKSLEVLPDKLNVTNELVGKITYPQPAG